MRGLKSHSCPECGSHVGLVRLFLQSRIRARWQCPRCSTKLRLDVTRRLLAAAIVGLEVGALCGVLRSLDVSWAWGILAGAVLWMTVAMIDKVVRVEEAG